MTSEEIRTVERLRALRTQVTTEMGGAAAVSHGASGGLITAG